MCDQPEVAEWKEWCLENTLTVLQSKFPESAVWIVRPSRMLRTMFTCYHNFVQSSLIGIPSYNATYGCLLQIDALLKDAIQKVIRLGVIELDVRSALVLPVVLVGFSKGCVVLNQLVHELVNYVVPEGLQRPRRIYLSVSTPSIHSGVLPPPAAMLRHRSPPAPRRQQQHCREEDSDGSISGGDRPHSADSRSRLSSTSSTRSERGTTPDAPLTPYRSSSFGAPASKHIMQPTATDVDNVTLLLGRLKGLYWLDAGHSGGTGAWVTDPDLLGMLAGLGVSVWVLVTPQQVMDPHRLWIGEEEREFVDKLRSCGATVNETLHFESEERSLNNHFRVITKL